MALNVQHLGALRKSDQPAFAYLGDLAVTDDFLFTASAATGTIDLWRIGAAGALSAAGQVAATATSGTTGLGDLWAGTAGGFTGVIPAGRYDDALVLHGLGPTGFAAPAAGWIGAAAGGYTAVLGVESNGTGLVVGARRGLSGLWIAPAQGGATPVAAATGDLPLEGVTALATARTGGRTFVLAAAGQSDAIAILELGAAGTLTPLGSLSKADGLPVDAPAALAVVEAPGGPYAILAAAGTSSLSVFRIGTGGALALTDHVLDTRETRFGAVSALATFETGGRTHVAAAGGDGGFTIFELDADGRLATVAVVVDDHATALAGVGALAAVSEGADTILFVASQGEGALDRFRLSAALTGLPQPAPDRVPLPDALGTPPGDPGPDPDPGDGGGGGGGPVPVPATLAGTAGPDDLRGGAGADVILDGGGRDRLTGGGGTDIFVFVYDRVPDAVTDFDPAEDRIDLALWRGARSLADLGITPTEWGAEIAFFEDRVYLASATGGPLDAAALADAFLFG